MRGYLEFAVIATISVLGAVVGTIAYISLEKSSQRANVARFTSSSDMLAKVFATEITDVVSTASAVALGVAQLRRVLGEPFPPEPPANGTAALNGTANGTARHLGTTTCPGETPFSGYIPATLFQDMVVANVERSLRASSGLQSLSYLPRTHPSLNESLAKALTRDYPPANASLPRRVVSFSDFCDDCKGVDHGGDLLVVSSIYPYTTGSAVVGLDLRSHPGRYNTLTSVLERQVHADVTPPIVLITATEKERGLAFLLVLPAFAIHKSFTRGSTHDAVPPGDVAGNIGDSSAGHCTIQSNRESSTTYESTGGSLLTGLVLGVFRSYNMLNDAFGVAGVTDLAVEWFDVTAAARLAVDSAAGENSDDTMDDVIGADLLEGGRDALRAAASVVANDSAPDSSTWWAPAPDSFASTASKVTDGVSGGAALRLSEAEGESPVLLTAVGGQVEDGAVYGSGQYSVSRLRHYATSGDSARLIVVPVGTRMWALGIETVGGLHSEGVENSSHLTVLIAVLALTLVVSLFLLFSRRQRRRLVTLNSRLDNQMVELDKSRVEAMAAAEAKGRFLALMSHELRTPLSGIMGLVDLLIAGGEEEGLGEEACSTLDMIARTGKSMIDLMGNILAFSKGEEGELAFEHVEVNLHNLVADVVQLLCARDGGAGDTSTPSVVVVWGHGVPGVVEGDPLRLRQCLLNLVGNSLKFTAPGGRIAVVVECVPRSPAPVGSEWGALPNRVDGEREALGRLDSAPVVVEPSPSAGSIREGAVLLRFTVADTGIGVSHDRILEIFRPFVQADVSTTREYGGTGLGLAIIRKVVLGMGGGVAMASEVGKGSEIMFTVPAVPVVNGGGGGKAAIGGSYHNNSNSSININIGMDDGDYVGEDDFVGSAATSGGRLSMVAKLGRVPAPCVAIVGMDRAAEVMYRSQIMAKVGQSVPLVCHVPTARDVGAACDSLVEASKRTGAAVVLLVDEACPPGLGGGLDSGVATGKNAPADAVASAPRSPSSTKKSEASEVARLLLQGLASAGVPRGAVVLTRAVRCPAVRHVLASALGTNVAVQRSTPAVNPESTWRSILLASVKATAGVQGVASAARESKPATMALVVVSAAPLSPRSSSDTDCYSYYSSGSDSAATAFTANSSVPPTAGAGPRWEATATGPGAGAGAGVGAGAVPAVNMPGAVPPAALGVRTESARPGPGPAVLADGGADHAQRSEAQAPTTVPSSLSSSSAPSAEPSGGGMRTTIAATTKDATDDPYVLVVDDAEVNVKLLTKLSSKAGRRTLIARDGVEAVEMFRERGGEIDTILCDFHMPRMDGFEATRQIRGMCRAGQRKAPLRILGLTADIATSVEDRAREAGMDDILIKPFSLAKIKQFLLHGRGK